MFNFLASNPLFFLEQSQELSLHDGFVGARRGGRIKGGHAYGAKHRGGARRWSRHRSLDGTIAEAEVDDAHALEHGQRLGS